VVDVTLDKLNFFKIISLKYSRFKLIFAVLLFPLLLHGQNQFLELPRINNYGSSTLEGIVNYSGIVLPDNTLMFANKNGVLKFDGTNWAIITIQDNKEVISLLYKDSIIYVGGNDEFGYLEPTTNGEYHYVSFKTYYSRKKPLDKFFQIVAVGDNVYFQNYGIIFRWDGAKLYEIPIEDAYIFNVHGVLFASIFGEGIALIGKDSVGLINSQFKFNEDAAYNIYPTSKLHQYNIYTNEHGIFNFNIIDNTTTPIKSKASDLFIRDGFYYVAPFLDSLWVATTSDGGVVVFSEEGNVLKFIDKSTGITGKFLRELFVDHRNKIWITSDVGISEIYWPKFDTLTTAKTKINEFRINDASVLATYEQHSNIPENAHILFKFSTPGFNTDEVEYSYRLEGGTGKWSKWEQYSVREYTQLKGGEYTFSVKSRTISGIETQTISITFQVFTPWHKTTTAYFLYLLGTIILLALLIWARTLKLNVTNKRLEQVVNKRTKELIEKSEALEATNEELRTKNQELDQFVYRSSHDLIAPLKSLKGLIYIVKSDKPSTNQIEYLDHMERSVLKLEDFIKSIIDFTTNANTSQKRENVDVDNIIDDLIEELKYFGKLGKIKLIKNLSLKTVQCDAKRLRIVLSNLLTNCVKYHNYDQPNPMIEIRTYKKNNQSIIEVEDNGQGIRPDLLNNIFDMFFRASDNSEGSGLGLYIVKDTVAKIGGVINVSSNYGTGTIFTIILNNEE